MPLTDKQIQADIAAVKDQILTMEDVRAMYPYPDGLLRSTNAVWRWFNYGELKRYMFQIGNTPCILIKHLEGFEPPRERKAGSNVPGKEYALAFRNMGIGEKIRATRQAQGRTQIDVGQKAGIKNNYLGDIEKGRTIPPLRTLVNIEESLGVYPLWSKELGDK